MNEIEISDPAKKAAELIVAMSPKLKRLSLAVEIIVQAAIEEGVAEFRNDADPDFN